MKPDIVDKLEVIIGPFSQNKFMEILYWAMLSFVRGRISPGRAEMKYTQKNATDFSAVTQSRLIHLGRWVSFIKALNLSA